MPIARADIPPAQALGHDIGGQFGGAEDAMQRSASEILNRINKISFNSSLMREMRAISFVTGLIDDDMVKIDTLKK